MNFELKSSLINMVQASPFCGKPNEYVNAHLQNFLELCDTIVILGVAADVVLQGEGHRHRSHIVASSPTGEGETMVLSEQRSRQHVGQVFHGVPRQILPIGKTNVIHGRISSF